MNEEQIRETFSYHAPTERKVKAFEYIRSLMTPTVVAISKEIPPSREKSLFIMHMQQAQMMANAAIAIHGHPDAP